MTIFIRVFKRKEKAEALVQIIEKKNQNVKVEDIIYSVDLTSFNSIPGSPFPYWADPELIELFSKYPPLEGEGRIARVGLQTSDDFRFVRTWWEVDPSRILDAENGPDFNENSKVFRQWCRERTFQGKRWVPFAKGGAYAPYYSDLHLVVNWESDGEGIRNFFDEKTGKLKSRPQNTDYYFLPGLMWPLRTTSQMSIRFYPCGAICSNKGPFIISNQQTQLIAIIQSKLYQSLILFQVAAAAAAARSYEVGLIQHTPIAFLDDSTATIIKNHVSRIISLLFYYERSNEIGHFFHKPLILRNSLDSIQGRIEVIREKMENDLSNFKSEQNRINTIILSIYGVSKELIERIEEQGEVYRYSIDHPNLHQSGDDLLSGLISYLLGVVLGRWQLNNSTLSEMQPFDLNSPLRIYQPGMVRKQSRHEDTSDGISVDNQDGIVVDDPNHSLDVIALVKKVLSALFERRAEDVENEICSLIGVDHLRDYFRNTSTGFWSNHLKRYSKSRRKAPIFWVLQSIKMNYSVWIYMHRLDKDTYHKVLSNYLEPKLNLEEDHLRELMDKNKRSGLPSSERRKVEAEVGAQESFVTELQDFRDKLMRVVELDLEPDLDDGVILNMAPLWELVPWDEPKKYWDKLLEGKYEWSSISKQLKRSGVH